jgi:hypothetical protein
MHDREQPAPQRFAICIRNDGCPASLERRKTYQVLPDADAERSGSIRVIDESGEDYLFPSSFFIEFELAPADVETLCRAFGSPHR